MVQLQVWVVRGSSLVEVPAAELGHFYSADAYVVLHSFKTPGGASAWREAHWEGRLGVMEKRGAGRLREGMQARTAGAGMWEAA